MPVVSREDIARIVKIDYSRDALLTDFGKRTLQDRYTVGDERPQDVFARAAVAFSGGDDALAQRLYDYASNLWFMFATPLIANGGTDRGLPISCFLNYVDDSVIGLAENFYENAFLSTNGGGIGSYWGHVRSVGEKTSKGVETPGAMPFMHVIDGQMMAYHQGSTRRGAAAVYMDISHPEIIPFIEMRQPTGGDIHSKNMNLHHGICLSDEFMMAVAKNADWDLVDPNSGRVHETVKARELWIRILSQRVKQGEPYLFFVDTANKHLPQSQKDKGLRVHHSNLCTEITLVTDATRTAVCCLSSINLAKRHEWHPHVEQFIDDIVTMLDNVLDIFINEAPTQMWRAVHSAVAERSIGIGTLGFHTYLQQEDIAIEHHDASALNIKIYQELREHAISASRRLAVERGEPEDMKGTGLRHAHLFAVAPNASTSIICGGVSPSIEPMAANAFTQKTQSGSHLVKNPALVTVLQSYGKDDDETWTSILAKKGSVQHLPFLTLWEKAVFRTFIEIDQMKLIDLAADRQPYICQAQSVNLSLPADVKASVLHKTHFAAWEKGLKSLYYLRSESIKSTEVVSTKVERIVRPDAEEKTQYDSDCVACEA